MHVGRMKILLICGSPHDGNTEIMLKKALEGCAGQGVETELVLLRNLEFKGCCGWSECFYENYCRIKKDGMFELYEKLLKADVWVLGTPNYFNNVSGLMKNFIDRTNPFCRPSLYKDKKVGLMVVGGWSASSNQKCLDALHDFCKCHKMKVAGQVSCVADKKDEILEKKEVLQQCFELGKQIAEEVKKEK